LEGGDEVIIQKVIDLNMSDYLLGKMRDIEQPHIQFEASWCVANICLGHHNQVNRMMEKGLVESVFKVLCNPYEKIFEQGAWIVAQVSSLDLEYQIKLLEANIPSLIANSMLHTKDPKIKKYTVWALSNLVRGEYQDPSIDYYFTALTKVLLESNDVEIIHYCLEPIYDRLNPIKCILFLRQGIIKKLAELTELKYDSVLDPLLKIFRYLSYQSDDDESYCKALIEFGVVDTLLAWLKKGDLKEDYINDCLYILSNITFGPEPFIQKVFKSREVFDMISQFAVHHNPEVRSGALYTICNSTHNGTPDRKMDLIRIGMFDLLHQNFNFEGLDTPTILLMLEAIENLLQTASTQQNGAQVMEEVMNKLEEIGIFEDLESCLNHESNAIYQRAYNLMENFFDIED
jgi:hypothetical protein